MTTRPADLTEVFYPETDGMPLPDGHFQGPLFREIVTTLEGRYKDRSDVTVSGNTFVYYEEGNPQRFVSPDCYAVFNISMESIIRFNTFRIWEVGKPPDFALEIGSPSTAETDLGYKRGLYARLGIGEYWRYDATGGDFYREPLVGEYLADGEYHRFELRQEPDGMLWGHSPTLNLDLCWDDGRLRFYDPVTGEWLLNYEEEQAGRLAAEERVRETEAARLAAEARARELEAARLAAEEQAREMESARLAAEERARELEAKLRRLRGESPQ